MYDTGLTHRPEGLCYFEESEVVGWNGPFDIGERWEARGVHRRRFPGGCSSRRHRVGSWKRGHSERHLGLGREEGEIFY